MSTMGGFEVDSFTARTGRGWTGIAHVRRHGRVVERISTEPVASERLALEQAAQQARERVLKRILAEFLCPQAPLSNF